MTNLYVRRIRKRKLICRLGPLRLKIIVRGWRIGSLKVREGWLIRQVVLRLMWIAWMVGWRVDGPIVRGRVGQVVVGRGVVVGVGGVDGALVRRWVR